MSGLLRIFRDRTDRSKRAAGNIAVSFLAKGISIICSLLIVPLTIEYVNPTQYGIWLTLSGIVAWIGYFDLGLGNGFRNKFAEARARGDDDTARQYVSTTYFALAVIMGLFLAILLVANQFVDWPAVLKVDALYHDELRNVFAVLALFFCLSMVFNVFGTLVTADQNPGLSAVVFAAGQVLSLLVIFILTKTTEGSLFNLAVYYAGIPAAVMLAASLIAFSFSKYKRFSPKISEIRLGLVKSILSLGVKFFIICVSLVAIFQVTNIILSRECGPESVTQYNVAYRYFNVLFSLMIIIITPFWSAFTDAYTKKDVAWMTSTVKKLELCWLLSVAGGLLMLALSKPFYGIWIGDKVSVPFLLSLFMFVNIIVSILGNIYMYMINGIGTIRLQLIIYLAAAFIAWPVMSLSARYLGVFGVLIFPTIVYLAQAVAGKIQITKLISGTGSGIWVK